LELYGECSYSIGTPDNSARTPKLSSMPDVKSVNVHLLSGRAVFAQGLSAGWWTDTLSFLRPDAKIQLTNEHLYKVRWFPDAK
jgi:hypothetical protein